MLIVHILFGEKEKCLADVIGRVQQCDSARYEYHLSKSLPVTSDSFIDVFDFDRV